MCAIDCQVESKGRDFELCLLWEGGPHHSEWPGPVPASSGYVAVEEEVRLRSSSEDIRYAEVGTYLLTGTVEMGRSRYGVVLYCT